MGTSSITGWCSIDRLCLAWQWDITTQCTGRSSYSMLFRPCAIFQFAVKRFTHHFSHLSCHLGVAIPFSDLISTILGLNPSLLILKLRLFRPKTQILDGLNHHVQGSLNVPIEHHPSIGDIISNRYWFRWCPLYSQVMGHLPTPDVGGNPKFHHFSMGNGTAGGSQVQLQQKEGHPSVRVFDRAVEDVQGRSTVGGSDRASGVTLWWTYKKLWKMAIYSGLC